MYAEPKASANSQEHIYNIDKMTFIVKPVHRECATKTILDLMLNLMVQENNKALYYAGL